MEVSSSISSPIGSKNIEIFKILFLGAKKEDSVIYGLVRDLINNITLVAISFDESAKRSFEISWSNANKLGSKIFLPNVVARMFNIKKIGERNREEIRSPLEETLMSQFDAKMPNVQAVKFVESTEMELWFKKWSESIINELVKWKLAIPDNSTRLDWQNNFVICINFVKNIHSSQNTGEWSLDNREDWIDENNTKSPQIERKIFNSSHPVAKPYYADKSEAEILKCISKASGFEESSEGDDEWSS